MDREFKLTNKQAVAYVYLKDDFTTEIGYGGGAGGGKAQPLSSKVLTLNGFKTMGELKVNDFVLTPSNNESRIIAVHPQGLKKVFEITFIDGSKVKCTGEHLWNCWIAGKKKGNKNRTTFELIDLIKKKNVLIPMNHNIEFGKDLSYDTYIIGALLGDGSLTTSSLNITTADQEIVDYFSKNIRFNNFVEKGKAKYRYNIKCGLRNKQGFPFNEFKDFLVKLGIHGVKCENKFVPKEILESSLNYRLGCIQGLMDTDGYIDSRGHVSFTSKSKQLVLDLQYLIRSVGGKATLRKVSKYCWYKGIKKSGIYWELYINSNDNSRFFKLTRKLNRVKNYNGGNELANRIISINKVGFEECKCITIEDEKGLYITNDFIITHNSYLGCYWVFSQCLGVPGVRYLIGRKELINLRKTTLATFFKMVGELGFIPTDLFRLNSMTNTIKFNNGSEIILMDMAYKPSDPEYLRFGGLELTGAFVDESNECEEKALSIIKTRIGRQKNKECGIKPKLLETFNPSKNHVYYRYYKPFKNGEQEEHKVFIPALVTDNLYLDDVYIDQLRKADKITRERLLHGNFDYDDDPARLFDFDSLNDLFTFKPVLEKDYVPTKYCTVDVARFGADLTTILLWKDFYVYKVKYFEKNDLKELVNYLEKLVVVEEIKRSNVLVDEDGVGGGVVDFFAGCKGFVNNSRQIEDKNKKNVIINFANLKTQCYYACADAVNTGSVGCYSSCPELVRNRLIEDLEQVKRKDPDKDEKIRIIGKDKIKENIGRSPDFGDAFMMRWWFELSPKFVFSFI